MKAFLDSQGVLLKDFGAYVKRTTGESKAHVQRLAAGAGRPYVYLADNHTKARGRSKEDLAREMAEADGITEGLICMLAAVEPCGSFDIFRTRDTCRLEVVRRRRKCLHFYAYLIDPEPGFCHVRLQSWFPFEVQVWANGREWLAHRLDRRGIGYTRHANVFVRVERWGVAQRLADRLARRRWPRLADRLARVVNPHLATICRAGFGGYYWVADQVEVATDVAFGTRPALEAVPSRSRTPRRRSPPRTCCASSGASSIRPWRPR
jgi:hypothetical protein